MESGITNTFETYGHEGFVSAVEALTCELRMGVAGAVWWGGGVCVNNASSLL